MRCPVCGTELERPGQGHTCRSVTPLASKPPTGWMVVTWVLIAFAALYLVFALLAAKVSLDIASAGDLAHIPPSRLAPMVTVTLGWWVLVVGTVIAQAIWTRRTLRLAERYGFDGALVIRHGFLRVYGLSVLATAFLQPLLGLGRSGGVLLIAVIRIAAGLVLLANVLVGCVRLLRLIADSARQSGQARTENATVPSTPPPTERDLDELWGRITP